MIGLVRGVVRGLVSLVVLAVVGYAGWRWGDPVFSRVEALFGFEARAESTLHEVVPPSPEIADRALGRYQAFRRDPTGRELSVSELEATSVLRFGLPGVLPSGVREPEVEFLDGGMRVRARVVRSAFPRFPDLGALGGMLPDTVPLEVDAALMSFAGGETALVVRRMTAGGIPVPRRLMPQLLDAMGRQGRAGLPEEAVLVPLPDEIHSAYVLSDSLRLVGR